MMLKIISLLITFLFLIICIKYLYDRWNNKVSDLGFDNACLIDIIGLILIIFCIIFVF